MIKKNKGFTLIELLVVIAIIGILSSVVLASLNTARNKGADAAIKADLANLKVQAELFYDGQNPNGYGVAANAASCTGGVFSDPNVRAIIAHLGTVSGSTANVYCGASNTVWGAAVKLKTAGFYCSDSTGISRDKDANGAAYTTLTGSLGAGAYNTTNYACN